MARFFFVFLLFGVILSTNSMAHSIRFNVEEHPPAVKVHAFFTMASPLVDAKVEVFKPGSDAVYQRGRTDEAGFFAFIPSEAGDWVVTVDDERGHLGRTVVSITEAFFRDDLPDQRAEQPQHDQGEELTDPPTEPPAPSTYPPATEPPAPSTYPPATEPHTHTTHDIPLFYRVIFGLALIIGITGFMYGMKVRKSGESS